MRLCDAEGAEFARGLCNYAFREVERMKVRNKLCLSTYDSGTVSVHCTEYSKVCFALHV